MTQPARRRVRRGAAVALAALVALPVASCGNDDEHTLTVLAAASLTGPFRELAGIYEARHPGVEVRLSFGSSTTLAQQVVDGAPGDVLATADDRAMQLAVDAEAVVGEPEPFVRNSLVIVTPRDNPADVTGPADLDRPGVDWVACVETAPCGALADDVLADADVGQAPVSQEIDVKAVLARVVAGEADAGLVYRSDAVAAGDAVQTFPLPGGHANSYRIGALDDSAAAADFLELVTGAPGRQVLQRAGFDWVRSADDGG